MRILDMNPSQINIAVGMGLGWSRTGPSVFLDAWELVEGDGALALIHRATNTLRPFNPTGDWAICGPLLALMEMQLLRGTLDAGTPNERPAVQACVPRELVPTVFQPEGGGGVAAVAEDERLAICIAYLLAKFGDAVEIPELSAPRIIAPHYSGPRIVK